MEAESLRKGIDTVRSRHNGGRGTVASFGRGGGHSGRRGVSAACLPQCKLLEPLLIDHVDVQPLERLDKLQDALPRSLAIDGVMQLRGRGADRGQAELSGPPSQLAQTRWQCATRVTTADDDTKLPPWFVCVGDAPRRGRLW